MAKTELKPEFLALASINSFVANTSSPRMAMEFNHQTQHLPLLNPEETLIKSGIEYELSKYINDVRTEHDCVVRAIIPKYSETGHPPICTLIVEYEENDQIFIDYIDVESYKSSHTFFGYRLHPTEAFKDLEYNSTIPKDTILAKTDSLGENGCYNYSVNANVAFMSHPSVAEDGYAISESFAKKLQYSSIVKRVINVTRDTIPVNTYGDSDNNIFKFIPDIGQQVRPDGLLCALRDRNDWFSVCDLNNNNLREMDVTFDTPIYVNPNSVVVDINVIRGNYNKSEFSSKMTKQLDEYAAMLLNYYRKVYSDYTRIMREKQKLFSSLDHVRLTPRMTRFVSDCKIKIKMAENHKNKLCYRKLPIDQYRIEVTTMSVMPVNLGNKITDIHAAKGVITRILPDDCMPVDELGNRVDIITDSMSTISRMNLGRSYQSYLGAVSRDNKRRLQNHLEQKYGTNYLQLMKSEDVAYCGEYLRNLYGMINPDMVEFIDSLNYEELDAHVRKVLTKNLYLWYPTDNELNIVDVLDTLDNSSFKPHLGKVTYTDDFNRRVTTVEDIRIGVLNFMNLEKIANNYSGVSSAKVNNFSFPVKGTNLDKFKYPHSLTPTKTLGETELRILLSLADPELAAELIDLSLNPISHKLLIKSVLESSMGYDVNFNIDRNVIGYNQTKSLGILRHIFNACGFTFSRKEDF